MKALNQIKSQLKGIESTFRKVNYPKTITIELTNRCNIKCIQCAHSDMKRPKGDMDIKLYQKIIDDIAENSPSSMVWLSCYGESLIIGCENISRMVSYAKSKGLTNLFMNTNGVLLSDEMAKVLVESGLDNLIVSINGFSSEVFESINIGARRDNVYNNVIGLKKTMIEKNVNTPRIQAQFIVMDKNEHEIDEYRHFWAKNNIAVKIRPKNTWGGNVEGEKNIDDSMERVACGLAVYDFQVLWNGDVVYCAHDINAEHILGNLNNETIKNVWDIYLEKMVTPHINHEFHLLPEFCRNCLDWQTIGSVNYDESGERYIKSYSYIKEGQQ